jgi:hypothetical protein
VTRDEAREENGNGMSLNHNQIDSTIRRAGALAALCMLAACTGDTLYLGEESDVDAPVVVIFDPPDGAQVLAGRIVQVLIAASDSVGVTEVVLNYRGVTSGSITVPITPPRTNVVVDTTVTLPAGVTGTLELQANAQNGLGARGTSETVTLNVTTGDQTAPSVSVNALTPARMELTDSIRVTVTGRDNAGGSGLTRLGVTVLVSSPGRPDTMAIEEVLNLNPPRSGVIQAEFRLPPPFVSEFDIPIDLRLEYHAFAVDSAGNCAANVNATLAGGPCGTLISAGNAFTVASAAAVPVPTTVVAGRSVNLPAASTVPDAAFDAQRERLYLSSMTRSRIEVLDVRNFTFTNSVLVGSEPWGVHINRSGDSLIVANSGGTNLSYVSLGAAPAEILSRRVSTPNSNVFIIQQTIDASGFSKLNVSFIDFSDRPQFLAQDIFGRVLYSTKPTSAAPEGTIRLVQNQPGWQAPEVKLLLNDLITEADSTRVSVVHVDSMRVFINLVGDDQLQIWDHVSGFPNQIITSGARPLAAALTAMDSFPQSDIVYAPGDFSLQLAGLSDVTFVGASGDRRRILFGEGTQNPGRLIMWDANTSDISNEITIADMVGNSAETISGIALNEDGTFNTARGVLGAYFFKDDLRLQGLASAPVATAGSGAQLHPDHPSYALGIPPSGPTTLAFVSAGNVIRIFDTVHFTERGVIPVRDVISGPLRVSRPLAGEATGCPGSNCIIAKLYGVTSAGTIVVVNVRTRDLQ